MGGKVRWEVKLGGRQSWVGDKVRWEVKLGGRQSWVGGTRNEVEQLHHTYTFYLISICIINCFSRSGSSSD